MIELGMIRDIVTIFGVIAGFTYYVLTVRNAQKTRELSLKAQEQALETRQTQIFMQIYQQFNTEEKYISWAELVNLEINDYDEYLQKYDSSVNTAHFGKRSQIWYSFNTIGVLLRQGIIEPDFVHQVQLDILAIVMWEKWENIIRETRVRENMPDLWEGFEYLYDEMKRLRSGRDYPEITYPQPKITI